MLFFSVVPSSNIWENEKKFLEQNGISVCQRSGEKDSPFFDLQDDTGYITYNIDNYTIADFQYGTITHIVGKIGKVVWMGRLKERGASVMVGMELVSGQSPLYNVVNTRRLSIWDMQSVCAIATLSISICCIVIVVWLWGACIRFLILQRLL